MKNVLKIGVPIILIAILIIGFIVKYKTARSPVTERPAAATDEQQVPAPSGNIDDITASFNLEAKQEAAGAVATSDQDASTVQAEAASALDAGGALTSGN